MKKLTLTLATFSTLALIGCGGGGGGSSSDGTAGGGAPSDQFKIQKVSYTLNGSTPPTCPNASTISTVNPQKEDGIGIQNCIWTCGDYEGANPISVGLFFEQHGKNGIWEFNMDVVSTAPQQCHN